MRDMHKWKDKAEFSLDNRQIFFLFFGLSVVGCFIFALGIMTGRRLQWEPEGQMATIPSSSLELLDAVEEEEPTFAFKQGIKESTIEERPKTREPDVPPRDEKEVKAEKAEQAKIAEAEAKKAQAAEKAEKAKIAQQAAKRESEAEKAKQTLAAVDAKNAKKPTGDAKKKKRTFTLQMKAFSHAEEAETLADKLRRNGHDIRVEQAEVKGRTWHRVRLGHYTDYDEAMGAKKQFENAEHVIAYVVAE